MEADTARLEFGLADAQARLGALTREVESLKQMFVGKGPQVIRVPSGVDGFNKTYEVLAEQLGDEPVDAAAAGTFLCSYSATDGTISVGPGGYEHPLGTNTDVPEKAASAGKYAYIIIKHKSAGVFDSFKIEVSSTTKDPVNKDTTDTFAEFSNCLLAEVVGSGDTAQLVQRRVGNLTLYHRVVDGELCLWPETTSGSPLT